MSNKYKIGDRVLISFEFSHSEKENIVSKGTVVALDDSNNPAVEFDERVVNAWGDVVGHNCNGDAKEEHGWYPAHHQITRLIKETSNEPPKKLIKRQPRSILGYHIKNMIGKNYEKG